MSAGWGSSAGPELRSVGPLPNAWFRPRKYTTRRIAAACPMFRMPITSEAVSSMRSDQYWGSPAPTLACDRASKTFCDISSCSPSSACRMSCPAVSCPGAVLRAEKAVVEIAHHLLEGVGGDPLEALAVLQDGLGDVEHQPGTADPSRVVVHHLLETRRADAPQLGQERLGHLLAVERRQDQLGALETSEQLRVAVGLARPGRGVRAGGACVRDARCHRR